MQVHMSAHILPYAYIHKHTSIYMKNSIYTHCEQKLEEKICPCKKYLYNIVHREIYLGNIS
jgi:hypothetical protein